MALTKLTTDLIDSTIVTSVNGSTGAVTLETGTDWQATPKTANFTAVAGEGYFVNTTSAAITVTLPSSPSNGDEVNLVDYAGTVSTNNIIITSSNNIQGSNNDKAIKYSNASVKLIYSDITRGWLVESNATSDSIGNNLPSSFSVDYLVVAGGGGTDLFSGGGGAGGLRTSFSGSTNGGGSALESTLTLSTDVSYNITVGSGGSGLGYVSPGGTATGSNSVFHNITSNGGAGGSYQTGTDGGSGGGAGCGSNPGSYSGGSALTSPTVQGYDGGNSGPRNGSGYPTGGGGGAGGAGQNYVSGTQAGNGGVGLSNSITGSAVFYAGGGGGAVINNYTAGTGGNGGGGDGINGAQTPNNGQPNTGGGGGGSSNNATTGVGSNGGSGIVVLRYPTGYTISGVSGTTTTDGAYDVTTFTAGTGTITFS